MKTKAEDLRVLKTRRTIRGALIELMSEKALSDITISELSEKAMINRKTFYRHYRAVSDVVTELENEILDEFSGILRSENRGVLDAGVVIRDISAVVERRREFFMKLMTHNPDVFNSGKLKAMLRRTLSVSLKSVGAADKETVDAAAEFMVSGILALYARWFDGGCAGNLDFITEISVRMVTEGLHGFVSDEKLTEISLK